MAWVKGQSGNPTGRQGEKRFADAIRLAANEIDEVSQKRKLRLIAERVVQEAISGESWAVAQVADRLDGKPAQESTVTFDDKRDATDWTREQLRAILAQSDATNGGGRGAETPGGDGGPDSVH